MTRRFRFELGLPFLDSVQVEITAGEPAHDDRADCDDRTGPDDPSLTAESRSPQPSERNAGPRPDAP